MIDATLLSLLRCPVDHSPLQINGDGLISATGRRYPVVEGVPVLLPSGISETIGYAGKSLQAAGQANREDSLYLETVGISDAERAGVRELVRQGRVAVDPVVSYLIAATGGNAYRHMIGHLEEYPIPEFRLTTSTPKLLLDLGCNWGRWCFSAAKNGYTPVGIDPQLGAVLAARRVAGKLGLKGYFVCGDARCLPFAAEAFDLVFSYSVLQHLSPENVATVLEQAAVVARADGRVYIQMPTRRGLVCFLQQVRRGFRPARGFEVRYWSFRDLELVFGRRFRAISFEVDCYLGIGLQSADFKYMGWPGKTAIRISDALRAAARRVTWLTRLADSVYVSAEKSSGAGAPDSGAEKSCSNPKSG